MAEPHDRKPILTIEQQIEHLKQKGVAFELCSEEEAADYLRDKCNFFKLASYRKLFSKYEGGPRDGRYVDLDFGQLRLLAALDQELRHALLGMTLDIEHFQKVTLLREMEDVERTATPSWPTTWHRLPLQTGSTACASSR